MIQIDRCDPSHREAWLKLRIELWPDEDADGLNAGITDMLKDNGGDFLALIACATDGRVVGFAEAALRFDYVNGCETSPVAFLEGIYVTPDYRRHGVAGALVRAVEEWAKLHRCREFASDALLENDQSHAMHKALGFVETERVVYFRKPL